MTRRPALVLVGVLAIAVGVAEAKASQRADPPAQQNQQQNQIQQLIADVYVNQFQSTVGLSEDQFLKVGTYIRNFIFLRFRIANQRDALNQRRARLLEQTDPSEADVRQLSEEMAQFDRTVGNQENQFIAKIQAELTPRQLLLVRPFNATFFEERLPRLIERARAQAAARGKTPGRPNGNPARRRDAQTPADAFQQRGNK